jgi:hypothetical protein
VSSEADERLAPHFAGVLFRPARTFERLAQAKSARPGLSAVAVLGIFWSIFCVLLWMNGEAPSFVLVPIPRADYYLIEGLLMTPLLSALFWIHSEIAHRIAKGEGTEAGARTALGFAYAAPMLCAHVLPELVAFLIGGFDTMALVGRFSLGIGALWVWALSAIALKIVHGASWPRAIGASFAGLFVQALAGSLVLR